MVRFRLRSALLGAVIAVSVTPAGVAGAAPRAAHATTPMSSPVGTPTNPDGTSGPPVPTGAPAMNRHGRVRVGTRLSCTDGTWANDPTAYRIRWRHGARLLHTGASYRVARADAGTVISCFVTATNAQGSGSVLGASVRVDGHRATGHHRRRRRPHPVAAGH